MMNSVRHDHYHLAIGMLWLCCTSNKEQAFSPFSLDAVNFLLADVRGALGPFLNVFLVTQQHWSQSKSDW